jgi:hypothetical protein
MTQAFDRKLDILPGAQRRLWDELGDTPQEFVLYGGTALALRCGHRKSVDFDFFSGKPFVARKLIEKVPYLPGQYQGNLRSPVQSSEYA